MTRTGGSLILAAPGGSRHREQDINDRCKDLMTAYKHPCVVQFVDALLKSGSGKVMWRLLQEAEKN